jgi:hypothetical protein
MCGDPLYIGEFLGHIGIAYLRGKFKDVVGQSEKSILRICFWSNDAAALWSVIGGMVDW